MSKLTRGQLQDLIVRFALENPRFRAALIADPKAILERQLNMSLGNVSIQTVIDTAYTVHVVVPFVPVEGELTDDDLEVVAGGKQDIEAECTVHGGGAINTVMQLNL